jgi:hypothetical protein
VGGGGSPFCSICKRITALGSTAFRPISKPRAWLRAIVELDLDELQTIDPPRGYGRD